MVREGAETVSEVLPSPATSHRICDTARLGRKTHKAALFPSDRGAVCSSE